MTSNSYDNLDRRLDQLIDQLNANQPPVVESVGGPELTELLDTALMLRQLREPTWPDDDFPDRLARELSSILPDPASLDGLMNDNGQPPVTRLPERTKQRKFRTFLWAAAMSVRSLSVVVMAGMISALVAGGIGGRIAMRMSGYLWEQEHPGTRTTTESSGQLIGTISIGGTLDLILQVMIFYGIGGGITYLLFRPLFNRFGRYAGLAYGLLLLLVAGAVVIDSGNRDFSRLGSPLLNILMFGTIFIGFGLLFVPLSRWLDRRLPMALPQRPFRKRSLLLYPIMLLFGGIGLLVLVEATILTVIMGSIGIVKAVSGSGNTIDLLLIVILPTVIILLLYRALISPIISEMVTRTGGSRSGLVQIAHQRRTTWVVGFSLALIALAGLVITLREIISILS